MLEKKRGYAYRRPFYAVDPDVEWSAGMVAFLKTDASGVPVATVAASGLVPIGTFWKDKNLGYYRTTIEEGTFNASDYLTLMKGNVTGSGADIKVTSSDGATTYTAGVDYSVAAANGVVTRLGGGAILAGATVLIWYRYVISAADINSQGGTNYDRLPDDTVGSGKIAVVEGFAHLFTNQFDVTQAYALNDAVRSNASSMWTTAVSVYSDTGRVIKVPTVSDPWLGIAQIQVTS